MLKEPTQEALVTAIEKRRADILDPWIQAVEARSGGQATSRELKQQLLPLFDALLAGMRIAKLDANRPEFDELRARLAEYSRTRARQGYSPSETAVAIFMLRPPVLSALAADGLLDEAPAFSKFLDDLGLFTFEAFVRTRETVITNQTQQLLELSTPVVKLWDGILAVPLVGTLDSARTQVVMESLLQALISTGSAHAIIDITGVPAVDTEVAQHLLKTVFAARLMGAECVISGIRPQIAQTIVGLGIEFGDIVTKASLADAFKLTLTRMGLEIRTRTQQRP